MGGTVFHSDAREAEGHGGTPKARTQEDTKRGV